MQHSGYSYGRAEDAMWFFASPTPGTENVGGLRYAGFASAPMADHPHGFYEEPFALTLNTTTPGGEIRYTLDGRAPTEEAGMVYVERIPVKENTIIRAATFATDYVPSEAITATYIIGASAFEKALPVISIVGDPEEALYEPNGVMAIVGGHYEQPGGPEWSWVPDGPEDYNNPMQRGEEYERAVSIEYFSAEDRAGFQIDCGIRIHGGDPLRASYVRGEDWLGDFKQKFSFRFYFRRQYGKGELDYPLFDGSDVDQFESLLLRGGHNDWTNPFIIDELGRRLYGDMGRVSSHGAFVHLFINGEYKAYYNLIERIDEDFCRAWFDSGNDWDVIDQGGPRDGTDEEWQALLEFVQTHDLSDEANYAQAAAMLKVRTFIDYLILQLYVGNFDWPDNNWITAREQDGNEEFTMFVYDTENSYETEWLNWTGLDHFPFDFGLGLNGQEVPLAQLYRSLKENAQFRALFSERVQEHLVADGGALTYDNLYARFEELRIAMQEVIPDMDTTIRDVWFPQRSAILLEKLEAEGLYTPAP